MVLDGGDVEDHPITSALVILSSFTHDIFIFGIILTLLCRKNSNFDSRDARSAHLSLPQWIILHGIAKKIRYLDFRSTEASIQELENPPMEADVASIMVFTSWSSRIL